MRLGKLTTEQVKVKIESVGLLSQLDRCTGKESEIFNETYAEVIALKRSYPAVSQIWALTVPPAFSVTPLVANSTPIVGYLFFGSSFLMYRLSKWVLPTPVSPTKITKTSKEMIQKW